MIAGAAGLWVLIVELAALVGDHGLIALDPGMAPRAVANSFGYGLGWHTLWAFDDGYPGDTAMTVATVMALLTVGGTGFLAQARWVRSELRQHWLLKDSLDNPKRRGYGKPPTVKEIRLR